MAYPDDIIDCAELAQIDTLEVIDYNRIQSMINTSAVRICECSTRDKGLVLDRINATHEDVRNILVSVGADINKNEQLIEVLNDGKTVGFLL